jgi:uncharacterized protein (TIGR02271 family)
MVGEVRTRLQGETDQPYAADRAISETKVSAQPRETAGESTIEVPLSEEEVKVGKRTVGAGEVKLHKTVTHGTGQRPCRVETRRHFNRPINLKAIFAPDTTHLTRIQNYCST